MKDEEIWLKQILESFKAPVPNPELVRQVQTKMREMLIKECRASDKRWFIFFVSLTAIATVPLFLLLNYLYYIGLQSLLVMLFPPTVVQPLVITFVILAALIGAICYGSVPIWIIHLSGYGEENGRV